MMEQRPVVSVVMAVYNTQRYVAQAVESILTQSFTDFEFVIIDDGSTDRSLKILQRYAKKDSRIRLISRENQGIPKTRNELLSYARGEFIAVMDSDDVAMRDRLKHQVDFFRIRPQVVCVGGYQDWIDEAGRVLKHHWEPEHNDEIQQYLLWGWTCINHPSAMMRRSAVMQVGGYDNSLALGEDLDLWFRLGEIGELANLPETVLHYRQHGRSISEARQKEQLQYIRQVCERAWQRRGIKGEFRADQPWRPYDRPSRHEYLLNYGWSFFNRGQRWSAVTYGWRAICTLPSRIDGWKLLVCSLVKRLPELESP